MGKLEKIQNEISLLSVEERELIGIFLRDKQNSTEPDYIKAWQLELQKRLDEVRTGNANLVSAKSVIADLRNRIRK